MKKCALIRNDKLLSYWSSLFNVYINGKDEMSGCKYTIGVKLEEDTGM